MKTKFDVKGMSCASCQIHVENAVKKLDGVQKVNVNLIQNNMYVEYDENVTVDDIEKAVKDAGYIAKISTNEQIEKKKYDIKLIKLIICFVFLLFLMYVSMFHMMFGFPIPAFLDEMEHPIAYVSLQLAILVPIIVLQRGYFTSGFKKLIKLHPNMDSLIAIGSSASVIYGIFALVMIIRGVSLNDMELIDSYIMNLYFESCAMILCLVSLGKYLEDLSKRKTTRSIEKLMDLAPKSAVVIRDGVEMTIDASEVLVDDILVGRMGEVISVDGIVLEGTCSIDQSNITGESVPVFKEKDDKVFSSTYVSSGYIKYIAKSVGDDTTIANIIKLVDEASNSKAPISKLADKISAIFVPVILLIALITFIVNLILSNFELAFNFAITVVVIACPCALGLATPVAIMVGSGKGAESGLLIRNAEILEKAQFVSTIVLDKTGTITYGHPHLTDIEIIKGTKEASLDILYSMESKSSHPLAEAICNYAKENNAKCLGVEEYLELEGEGIKARIDGIVYYVGNMRMLIKLNLSNDLVQEMFDRYSKEAKTPLMLMTDSEVVAILAIKDEAKESSIKAIEELKKNEIEVIMLTGDNAESAKAIALDVGIEKVISDVIPQDKQRIINSLKKDDKHLVAMVGDGVNDALALTSADLGIAIGAGSDIALDSSDIVLLRNDLLDVVNVIKLSKRVLRTIKINLFWAFFYNSICVLLATGILYYINGFKISPMIGAIAMSISSVSVVLNALTINLFKPIKLEDKNKIVLKVKGMMCENCERHVMDSAMKVDGIIYAKADHKANTLTIEVDKEIDYQKLKEEIAQEGYTLKL